LRSGGELAQASFTRPKFSLPALDSFHALMRYLALASSVFRQISADNDATLPGGLALSCPNELGYGEHIQPYSTPVVAGSANGRRQENCKRGR
jgi:hypothetical protein